MTGRPRARGVLLTTLDFGRLTKTVRDRYAIPPDATVTLGYGYVLGRHNGRTYAICSEGVGWDITPPRLTLDVYVASPGTTAIAPQYAIELTPDEVLEYEQVYDVVDLADFVRGFGARLEANFWLWHRTLTGNETTRPTHS
jgi:hypothetical protein